MKRWNEQLGASELVCSTEGHLQFLSTTPTSSHPTSQDGAGVWGIRVVVGGEPLQEVKAERPEGKDALPDRGRGVLQLPPGLGGV